MKTINFIILFIFSITTLSQKNLETLYSNIYTANTSDKFVNKYPVNDYNRSQRNHNKNKLSQDSIDNNFNKCINEFRKDYGLPALKYDVELSKIAYIQLSYISSSDNIGHYNPDFGATPIDRAKFAGYNNFYWIGEICLMDKRDLSEYPNYSSVNLEYTRTIFDLYWTSLSHRKLLQDTKFKRYGFCNYYNTSTGKFYNVTILMD